MTIVGKNEIYNRENLVRPFLVHQVLGPKPLPPSPPPAQKKPCFRGIEARMLQLHPQATQWPLQSQGSSDHSRNIAWPSRLHRGGGEGTISLFSFVPKFPPPKFFRAIRGTSCSLCIVSGGGCRVVLRRGRHVRSFCSLGSGKLVVVENVEQRRPHFLAVGGNSAPPGGGGAVTRPPPPPYGDLWLGMLTCPSSDGPAPKSEVCRNCPKTTPPPPHPPATTWTQRFRMCRRTVAGSVHCRGHAARLTDPLEAPPLPLPPPSPSRMLSLEGGGGGGHHSLKGGHPPQ